MAKSFKRIRNFNVSVKEIDGKVVFLRKLVKGGSEHSFGIHVAKIAGMPPSIVNRATEVLRQLLYLAGKQREYDQGTVEQVTLPGVMGQFQVLKIHAALIAALKAGRISYVTDGQTVERDIHGGVADVKDNVVSVCLY